MRKFLGPVGSVSHVTIESHALERNMLGDPTARVVDIYVRGLHRPNPTNTVGGAVAAIRDDLSALEQLLSTPRTNKRHLRPTS